MVMLRGSIADEHAAEASRGAITAASKQSAGRPPYGRPLPTSN
jgi:hypothetical protein